uniref:Uncharacterized protein n=1 Tax=Timema tahoe TaxID=61484 RepID=A0A7R9INV8_9NEOP|nr:unnamed protein product [Timema tahoe]
MERLTTQNERMTTMFTNSNHAVLSEIISSVFICDADMLSSAHAWLALQEETRLETPVGDISNDSPQNVFGTRNGVEPGTPEYGLFLTNKAPTSSKKLWIDSHQDRAKSSSMVRNIKDLYRLPHCILQSPRQLFGLRVDIVALCHWTGQYQFTPQLLPISFAHVVSPSFPFPISIHQPPLGKVKDDQVMITERDVVHNPPIFHHVHGLGVTQSDVNVGRSPSSPLICRGIIRLVCNLNGSAHKKYI